MSLRNAERQFGVPARTIGRKKVIAVKGGDPTKVLQTGRPVFKEHEECQLEQYLFTANDRLLGLARPELRSLAFDFAQRLQRPNKFNVQKQKAGYQWLNGFMKRNPRVSVRIPQATSLNRAKAFTREKVMRFYNNLETVMEKKSYSASNIWNMDETGFSIVQKPLPVFARRGTNSVGRITSGERGRLFTAIYACNASGTFVPPMMVFPGRKFKDEMLQDAPVGSVGTCTPSGWSNQEVFIQWLNHFIACTKPSADNPALIVLDNHTSHITHEAIDMCINNEITLVSLPPHSSNKLQPLDVSVFKGLKSSLRTVQHIWLSRHAPERLTEKHLPLIFSQAYEASANAENAISGFAATGIFPFNPNVFKPEDFITADIFSEAHNPPESADDSTNQTSGIQHQERCLDEDSVPGVVTVSEPPGLDAEGHVYDNNSERAEGDDVCDGDLDESDESVRDDDTEDDSQPDDYEPIAESSFLDNPGLEVIDISDCEDGDVDAGVFSLDDKEAHGNAYMDEDTDMHADEDRDTGHDLGTDGDADKDESLDTDRDKEVEILTKERELLEREKILIAKERDLYEREARMLEKEKQLLNPKNFQTPITGLRKHAQDVSNRQSKPKFAKKLSLIQRPAFYSDLSQSQITPHSLRPLIPSTKTVKQRSSRAQFSEILTSPAMQKSLLDKLSKKIAKSEGSKGSGSPGNQAGGKSACSKSGKVGNRKLGATGGKKKGNSA